MASIRNRQGKWQARIIRKGYAPITKSFLAKQDAERWARQIESDIDKGSYTNSVFADRTTFSEVIQRYIQEVVSKGRGYKEHSYRLKALAKRPIAQLRMTALTPLKVAEYRDERAKVIAPATLIHELAYFSAIINHAKREWGISIINPIPMVKKPPMPQGRNRILNEEELSRLYTALTPRVKNANHWILPLTKFALESAMRRGEILGLRWEEIDLEKRIAFIPLTKNGESRTVPLSTAAVEILKTLPRNLHGEVFPVNRTALSAAIERARIKAELSDFHFHDLRHMAITRLAEKLPNLIELSAVSGHKSLAMLKRYYHPNPELLAQKLG
ncbi:site-specific integrase [Polynucleobacter sp. es-MAR-4]|uniref:site-specific integrase n=1 Tax=Polynucleobacter sp. es-MAR-4 TaxID=1855655 RepID=UPI001C0C8BB0|nr:site-specific integrase [Polynucleobacter sp. es-MAR-4]MBU3636981.1 site-specific integrase [Polynucleobacter sp. es-MAR-4]